MITDLISIVEYFKNYSNQCSFLRMTLTYLKMRAKADTLALNDNFNLPLYSNHLHLNLIQALSTRLIILPERVLATCL